MPRFIVVILLMAISCCPAGEPAKDFSVPGFVKPAANEHPRLFFRAADLAKLKERAATPEGKRIIARLRYQLDGGSGTTLPAKRNPLPAGDDPGELLSEPVGSVFTLFHSAGYGMLWRLTGDKAAAELASEAAMLVISGQSDRDARFGLKAPAGGEYSGAAVAALALAYDLCHDAWDDATRQRVVDAIESTAKSGNPSFLAAVLWQLAVAGDAIGGKPIRTNDPLSRLSGELARLPPFGFSGRDVDVHDAMRDVLLPLVVHASRVAGGIDLVAGQPRLGQLVDRLIYLAVPGPSGLQLALPYDYLPMYGQHLDRTGLAGGGEFVQAMAMSTPVQRSALRFIYEHFCVPRLGRDHPNSGVRDGEHDYDTVGPYPHRAMLALTCWPFDEPARDPATVLPPIVTAEDANRGIPICIFRGGWNGPDDIVVTIMGGVGLQGRELAEPRKPGLLCRIWACGKRYVMVGTSNGFDRPVGLVYGLKQVAERRWLVSFSKNWGASTSHPPPARLIVDLGGRDGRDAVIITEAVNIIGDLPDADRVTRFDLGGQWRCSSSLTVSVNQEGSAFHVAADNPWGNGKPVVGRIVGDQVSLIRTGNGVARGLVAPHGHVITWEDGAVWRRTSSPLEAPMRLTSEPGQRTLVRQTNNKPRNTLMCILTCSADGRHEEFTCVGGDFPVVAVGERSFSFSPDPNAPSPAPQAEGGTKPSAGSGTKADQPKAAATKLP
ncbi:hypothetical protein LBMAG53_20160 [Planctomycetota bacterium]|nr:hypothetical protein LBMAG53_20160 [Planctomycetota bacterium]